MVRKPQEVPHGIITINEFVAGFRYFCARNVGEIDFFVFV